jgi:hypothetical protein
MLGVRGGSNQQQLPQIVNLHSEAISNQRNLKKRSLLEEITKNQMSRHVGGGGGKYFFTALIATVSL